MFGFEGLGCLTFFLVVDVYYLVVVFVLSLLVFIVYFMCLSLSLSLLSLLLLGFSLCFFFVIVFDAFDSSLTKKLHFL